MSAVRLTEEEFRARLRERVNAYLALVSEVGVENGCVDDDGTVHDLAALLGVAATAAQRVAFYGAPPDHSETLRRHKLSRR